MLVVISSHSSTELVREKCFHHLDLEPSSCQPWLLHHSLLPAAAHQHLHAVNVLPSYLATAYLKQSEEALMWGGKKWEVRKGQFKLKEVSRPVHTATTTMCGSRYSEKYLSVCPLKPEAQIQGGPRCGIQCHLRVEIFAILNKTKMRRHLLNTGVDRTELQYELKQTIQPSRGQLEIWELSFRMESKEKWHFTFCLKQAIPSKCLISSEEEKSLSTSFLKRKAHL